ncbi:MAG TPA: 50S ribosomal protein L10 [Planctomycetes bacterium]|nr:50S ribosomal protein L10 [Planctomycetota bacterium]
MPNIFNRLAYKEFEREVEEMGSCIFVRFDKLKISQDFELRNQLREKGLRFQVIRNRLMSLAMKDEGYDSFPKLTGKIGVVFAKDEGAITAAKVIRDFAKANKGCTLEFVAGILEGEVLEGEAAKSFADLPDKDTLRSMLLSVIQGPGRGLAAALQGLPAGLARCIQEKFSAEESAS